MFDYELKYKIFIDDIEINPVTTIITIEEDYIEDQELLEDILLEKLKEEMGNNKVEIIDFYPVIQTEQANLYRITDEDVYYNEYTYKGDIRDMTKEFIGKDMKEVLDCIKDYKTK
jgi:hypothetical protein